MSLTPERLAAPMPLAEAIERAGQITAFTENDRRALSALVEAAKRLRAERTWRTMESAPKDGTYFLISWGDDIPVVAWFEHGHFYYSRRGSVIKLSSEPLWTPMPAPPTTGDQEETSDRH